MFAHSFIFIQRKFFFFFNQSFMRQATFLEDVRGTVPANVHDDVFSDDIFSDDIFSLSVLVDVAWQQSSSIGTRFQ